MKRKLTGILVISIAFILLIGVVGGFYDYAILGNGFRAASILSISVSFVFFFVLLYLVKEIAVLGFNIFKG